MRKPAKSPAKPLVCLSMCEFLLGTRPDHAYSARDPNWFLTHDSIKEVRKLYRELGVTKR